MALTSTAQVVDLKLSPITAAVAVVAPQITTQGLQEFANSFIVIGKTADADKALAVARSTDISRNASPEELDRALSGIVEGTRSSVEKDGKSKREDGDNTAMARKFASHLRAVYGAVKFKRMTQDEAFAFYNSEKLYSYACKVLAGDEERGIPAIVWNGELVTQRDARNAARKVRGSMKDAAEEMGVDDVLDLSPEQFSALKAKAQSLANTKAIKARIEKVEKAAAKLAASLVRDYGFDDADDILSRAREAVAQLAIAGGLVAVE